MINYFLMSLAFALFVPRDARRSIGLVKIVVVIFAVVAGVNSVVVGN